MQPLIFLVALATLGVYAKAQTPDSFPRMFIEVSPFFRNDVDAIPFGLNVKNENTGYTNSKNRIEEPISQAFFDCKMNMSYSLHLKHGWYTTVKYGFGYGEYSARLNYKTFTSGNYSYEDDREHITHFWGEVKAGAGKMIYLDRSGRVLLQSELLAGSSVDYYKSKYELGPTTGYSYVHKQIRIGMQANIGINYRFTRRLAIGLTLNNVLSLNHVNTKEGPLDDDVNRSRIEFTFAKLTAPRLGIILQVFKPR